MMRLNRLISLTFVVLFFFVSFSCTREIEISIIETTDVHGVVLPYDYIEKEPLDYSLASCFTYIKEIRSQKDISFLIDNGDNLQGQPEVYYYNFIDTVSPHFLSEVMNFMDYDVGTVGNHDIEAGHSVYDRLVKEYKFPLLAANAVDVKTGEPYFKPYCIIEKRGVRVAFFGLVTPAIPEWLPEELYSGIEFKDMLETAKLWMPIILKEKPDLVVGLFHSGWDRSRNVEEPGNSPYENGSASVAFNVPGFDIIFNGHDHKIANETIVNSAGDEVLIIDGGSRSERMGEADITISRKSFRKNQIVEIEGKILNSSDYKPDNEFITRFKPQHKIVSDYVNRIIGNCSADISSRDSYFGSSAFVDMIHSIQLEITEADVSFAAPLSFDVKIAKGPVTVGDMFKLYRFENMLYTMNLSGREVKKYLEYSYSEWLNTMSGPDDYLLNYRTEKNGKVYMTNGKAWLKNQPYNFDSAVGIDYIVDVSKPSGSRILIKGMSDGRPFNPDQIYKIAVNSYRGNGGGGHFTEGAGISKDELKKSLLSSTDRDLRYYILKSIEDRKLITPEPVNNWKIIPETWVKKARAKEYKMLFGAGK